MTHPSKRKGNTFEREIVNEARRRGFEAQRAYASNGLSLGFTEDVDCVVDGLRVQAKRRAKLAQFLQPTPGVDAVAIRQDRGSTLVIVSYETLLQLLADRQPPPPPNAMTHLPPKKRRMIRQIARNAYMVHDGNRDAAIDQATSEIREAANTGLLATILLGVAIQLAIDLIVWWIENAILSPEVEPHSAEPGEVTE